MGASLANIDHIFLFRLQIHSLLDFSSTFLYNFAKLSHSCWVQMTLWESSRGNKNCFRRLYGDAVPSTGIRREEAWLGAALVAVAQAETSE
jgi:hypothetical protein